MKKLLYLPIEIKHRELLAKILIAFFAAKKNFYSIIGDKEAIERSIRYFGEGIYFDKSISLNKNQKLKKLKNKNIKVVCQDEEGGFNKIFKKHISTFFNKRIPPENLSLIEQFYCWGSFDYKELKKRNKKNQKKIFETGSPRIDLWKKKFISKIFNNEINIIKKTHGDFLLFPTSFGITSLEEKKKRIKQAKFLNYIKSKNEIKLQKIEYDNLYSNFLEFVELIRYLSKKFPKQKIIIRPHFAENKSDWEKKFKEYRNVEINNDHDISLWIIASKIVLHNGSTTGIQSYAMNKPVIIYSTKYSHLRQNTYPNKYGKVINNKTKIYEYLKKSNFRLVRKKIDRIIISNQFISNDIVKNLNKIKVKKNNKFKSYIPFLLNFFYILRKLRISKASKLLTKTYIRNYNEKMPGGLKKIEIQEFINRLELYFKVQKSIKVRYCGPNCFLIYKIK